MIRKHLGDDLIDARLITQDRFTIIALSMLFSLSSLTRLLE